MGRIIMLLTCTVPASILLSEDGSFINCTVHDIKRQLIQMVFSLVYTKPPAASPAAFMSSAQVFNNLGALRPHFKSHRSNLKPTIIKIVIHTFSGNFKTKHLIPSWGKMCLLT